MARKPPPGTRPHGGTRRLDSRRLLPRAAREQVSVLGSLQASGHLLQQPEGTNIPLPAPFPEEGPQLASDC